MNKKLLLTFTDEIIQPVRLNYKIFNEFELLNSLNKIKDFEYVKEKNLFKWLLKKGEKKFGLKINKNIKMLEKTDIVLGNLIIKDKKLYIILPSIKRAIIAIQFFDKIISREIVKIETLDVINKFFEDSVENRQEIINLENIFENKEISKKDPELLIKEIYELKEKGIPQAQLIEYMNKKIEEDTKKDLPEIENLPVNYYSDGIQQTEVGLTMRKIVLFERFNGNKSFTFNDIMQSMINDSYEKSKIRKDKIEYIN